MRRQAIDKIGCLMCELAKAGKPHRQSGCRLCHSIASISLGTIPYWLWDPFARSRFAGKLDEILISSIEKIANSLMNWCFGIVELDRTL